MEDIIYSIKTHKGREFYDNNGKFIGTDQIEGAYGHEIDEGSKERVQSIKVTFRFAELRDMKHLIDSIKA